MMKRKELEILILTIAVNVILTFGISLLFGISYYYLYRIWDASDYITMAENGIYPASNRYFTLRFMLFPVILSLIYKIPADHNLLTFIYLCVINALSSVVFFRICKLYFDEDTSFLLALVFIFFPPRKLTLSVISMSESTALLFLMLSYLYFKESRYLMSSVFLTLTTLTRFNFFLSIIPMGPALPVEAWEQSSILIPNLLFPIQNFLSGRGRFTLGQKEIPCIFIRF